MPQSLKLFVALLTVGLCHFCTEPVNAKSPNIVTVFIDDMGFTDLSCFGGKQTVTENIDRLASEGIQFTNFYVNSPICSPSRTALTTGHYPQRWRITSYLNNRKSNDQRGVAQWLDLKAPVLARELQKAGYATGHFGKWHMGGQRDVGEAPLISEYGFDRSLTNFEGLGPRVLGYKDDFKGGKPQLHDLGSNSLARGPIEYADRSEITGKFVQRALSHIDDAAAKDQPFFVNLWPDDVHSPFFPPEVLRDATDESKRQLYYAVLDAMDEQLAPLFDRIRGDDKLKSNTLILVCSDNGHEPGAGMSDPLRGSKALLYEAGIRSPLIVWGPGLQAKDKVGTKNETSIFSAIDVNRSLYSLASVPVAEGVKLDGEDVLDTMLGKSTDGRHAPIFFRRPPDRPGGLSGKNKDAASEADAPDLAVREGKWKYLIDYDETDPQLYDLNVDASESNNVVDVHTKTAARLKMALLEWNQTMPADAGDPNFGKVGSLPADKFVNPIGEGADPWVIRDPNADRYLWCFSEGNKAIAIHTSDALTSFGTKHIVWETPDSGPWSDEVWAPELHFLDGKWHVYFAASDGKNENHLAYVLVSDDADPLGQYTLHGPFATGDGDDGKSPNVWAIDMTVLEHGGGRYAIWSGWDAPGTDQQFLYISPMKSPTELAAPRVRICSNDDFPWEFTDGDGKGRGLNEGAQVLKSGKRTFVTYSCGGSWLPTYKLGMLELTGDDPLDPKSWVKKREPVFDGTPETFGVGHSCFVTAPDGSEHWHVFHAKRDRDPGWRRGVHVQPMTFNKKTGVPQFGIPVKAGDPLSRPAGEKIKKLGLPYTSSLSGVFDSDQWAYYGHHQRYRFTRDGVLLGITPDAPINDFPTGEKLMLRDGAFSDFAATVSIDDTSVAENGTAGIVFRVTGSALGYDAFRGYYAGFNPDGGYASIGKMDGTNFHMLKRVKVTVPTDRAVQLTAIAKGDRLTLLLDGQEVISLTDEDYAQGTVGIRVVRTEAIFRDLVVTH
ncbi:MAG: sulfatase-like hydrolase/transferase [Pirellulaceae bacterium]